MQLSGGDVAQKATSGDLGVSDAVTSHLDFLTDVLDSCNVHTHGWKPWREWRLCACLREPAPKLFGCCSKNSGHNSLPSEPSVPQKKHQERVVKMEGEQSFFPADNLPWLLQLCLYEMGLLYRTSCKDVRLTITIDDLDRCEADNVVRFLEAVMVLLNRDTTTSGKKVQLVMILAVGPRVVVRQIELHFKGLFNMANLTVACSAHCMLFPLNYCFAPLDLFPHDTCDC